jgi:subtilisin
MASVAGISRAALVAALVGAACAQDAQVVGVGGTSESLVTGPRDYIVVLKSGEPEAVAGTVGIEPQKVYRHALRGFAATLSPQAAQALERNPNVEFIEPDYTVHAVAQTLPTGVDRMEVDLAKALGTGVVVDVDVAVIDTGIDPTHSDLNVFRRTDCARKGPLNTTCAEGAGVDGNGHGTHVAGTIGARDNNLGVVGVAPGARLWAARVLDNAGNGYNSWVIAGIDWVAANASSIEVANMSLGGTGSDDGNCGNTNRDAMHKAICGAVAKGVVFVVAAGNESDDAAFHTPAAYDEVITVSALTDLDGVAGGSGTENCRTSPENDDSLAYFSNFGADVDLMAPGYCITSTWTGGGYDTISGTSMASPHVTGLAAAYLARLGAKPTTKAGVLAVRDALIADAVAQGDPCGLALADDPDGYPEPLAFANGTSLGGDGRCEGVTPACALDVDCDDGDACNGLEACVAGACQAGVAIDCSNGDACDGAEACDPATGLCVAGEPLDCSDGNACNGLETCSPEAGCTAGSAVNCDDGDACTTDGCNPTDGSCSHAAKTCDDGNICTSDACDPGTGCSHAPSAGSCDDGNACTSGDSCTDGICLGSGSCPAPVCTPVAAACTSNADCCSGKCRGKTCR